ncbi:MAG: hypothetical protein ACO29O_07230 [Chitinophagaceae bacterium]
MLSWHNNYRDIVRISIQRSHDSINGFKTIATIAKPNERINGFLDKRAPNTSQYYRLQIERWLDGISFTNVVKPSADSPSTDLKKFEIQNTISDKATTEAKSNSSFPTSSIYVFINREGNVHIALPDAKMKNYSVKFFRDNGSLALYLKRVRENELTLDKSNFINAGWYIFELYDDSRLMEKNKILIQKD